MAKRKIIKINEELCNGCGQCIPNCHEGALRIIDGKARLVSDVLCDGLGACLGHCPMGAITIEEREAPAFVEPEKLPCGCPGTNMLDRRSTKKESSEPKIDQSSALRQWPVQLALLNPQAPYFKDTNLLIAADCVPFAYANFHQDFLKDKTLVIFCPKLDEDIEGYVVKLSEIMKLNNIHSITVVHMEVPCCFSAEQVVKQALERSGKRIPFLKQIISLEGEIKK